MAQAEDSAGIEYRDAPPSATGEIPTHSGSPATTSKKNGGAQAPGSTNSNKSDNESTEGNSGEGGGAGANGGGGQGNSGGGQGGSGSGQGNPGSSPGASNLSNAQSVGNSPAGTDGGGSSPLVPILIAIAVVMAVAIAAVVIRQRRQRRGPDAHVSPEAS